VYRTARQFSQLWSMIIVLNALDIVLAQIASGLHLDQFQIDLTRIFEAVVGANRHIENSNAPRQSLAHRAQFSTEANPMVESEVANERRLTCSPTCPR
jgi:hypothetical protein